MKIFVTDFDGIQHECEGIEGWRIMEIIRDYGLPIKAECGGACLCGTCHVYVAPEWLTKLYPKTEDEEDQLMDVAVGLQDNSRLSCQILMSEALDGLCVTMAPGSQKD
ncbi:MAG: 2Fe-2S iron-sulfur cluster-binding protein [Pseudomonadota bacterium]